MATALLRAGSRGCCSIRWLRAAQLEKEIFLPLWESSRAAWLQRTSTPSGVAGEHNRQSGTNCHPPELGSASKQSPKNTAFWEKGQSRSCSWTATCQSHSRFPQAVCFAIVAPAVGDPCMPRVLEFHVLMGNLTQAIITSQKTLC